MGASAGTTSAAGRVVAARARDAGLDTLCAAFAHTVARYPERIALRGSAGERVTWGEYGARVRDLAAALHELGVARGDRVVLLLRAGIAFHLVDAAAMHLGAIALTADPAAPGSRLDRILREIGPRLVFAEEDLGRRLNARCTLTTADLAALEGRGAASRFDVAAAAARARPGDVLTLAVTAGATGAPQAIELTHANVLYVARAMAQTCPLPDGATVLARLPIASIVARGAAHYWPMVFGHCAGAAPEDAELLEALRAVRPQLLLGRPATFAAVRAHLAAGPRACGLDGLAIGLMAGAAGPAEAVADLRRRGLAVAATWGLSECGGFATLDATGGRAGAPLPGTEVRRAADGELELRSPGVMRGYRDRPDLTAEAIAPGGWLRTGHLGEVHADGRVSVGACRGGHGPELSGATVSNQPYGHVPFLSLPSRHRRDAP